MGLLGADRVPAEVRAHAGVGRSAALASARAEDCWLLGTRDRLVVVPDQGEVQALAWPDVEGATWESEARALVVTATAAWGEERPRHRFAFARSEDPARLLQLLRERITASILLQRRVLVRGKRGLTVRGRRPPSGGEVAWSVEYDAGVDPADPAVQALAGAALAAAQAEV